MFYSESVQGVVGCGETVLYIWGDKEQNVSWEGCGFNVTVPAGAVPKGVTVNLIVKANLSSQFKVQVGDHLVSATYWVLSSYVFQKDVFVHLYHWANIASKEEASNYKVIVRKWSQKTRSYMFRILEGVFEAHSQLATFSMKSFSAIQAQGEKKLRYEFYYYLKQISRLKWEATFIFTPQYPPNMQVCVFI